MLSPVLLAALTAAPAQAAPSTAVQGPPTASGAGTPQHAENSRALPINDYDDGYKAGKRAGKRDGQDEECDDYTGSDNPPGKRSKSYKKGYYRGYYKGFQDTCDD